MLVVDGNNVMGSRPDGWWKDRPAAARRLVAQIGAWAGDDDVLVIFDGAPVADMPSFERVEIRYATRRGRDAADDDIAAYAAAHPGARVVTSDADLARRAREAGADVVGARWLLDRL